MLLIYGFLQGLIVETPVYAKSFSWRVAKWKWPVRAMALIKESR
jgi:hypothetical protein